MHHELEIGSIIASLLSAPTHLNNTCATFRRKMWDHSYHSKYHSSSMKFELGVAFSRIFIHCHDLIIIQFLNGVFHAR